MAAVALIIASAALHAAWNFAVRRHGQARAATAWMVTGSVALTLPLALVRAPHGWAGALPWGLCAGVGEAIYFLTLSRALEIGPLAAVYTVSRGSSMLLLWPASHLLLEEAFGWREGLAVAFLFLGLALLAPTDSTKPEQTTSKAGYSWAFACGLCITLFQLVYKGAVDRGHDPLQIFFISMATALPVAIWNIGGLLRTVLQRFRAAANVRLDLLAFGSVAMAVSFLIALYVLRSHGSAWVVTLRNSSVAFAQLFGWALLKERPTARAGVGVALVFVDALLLGTG